MDDYAPAVDREFGKVDTDSGGLARYSLKLQVPPGIGHGNEPEISLEYSQGCPNGSLGTGWALGGLSCIRRGPSNLAFDGANTPPADYDRFQPKFTLDGVELLNVQGKYATPDAMYTTEIDDLGRTVLPLGSGFQVLDSIGRRMEYGTTADSQVLIAGTQTIREWRLKKQIDCHGNAVAYSYVASPQTEGSVADINTCYLSTIRYTSNDKTGHPGNRIVRFDYIPRSDVVVQTVQGDKAVWSHLLSAIRFGVIRDDDVRIDRSYELSYSKSQFTGDSCLVSVMETAGYANENVNLLPSSFSYTSPGVSPKELFKSDDQRITKLQNTTNNVTLFTLNTSGRCLADIACIRYDQKSKSMTLKTYLAVRNADGTIDWKPSDGPGAEATLPPIDLSDGFPSILSPDMNGDGRSDFIVPYKDKDGMIRFSISQSVGTGYQNSRAKTTLCPWTNESKFMAIDLSGRGSTEIVQIFTEKQKLAFRTFSGVIENGQIAMKDPVLSRTSYENIGTIDWFQLSHANTGAKSLVRVWAEDRNGGKSQMMATTFTASYADNVSGVFREDKTSLLGEPVRVAQTKCSVLACDINGDGTQDIVLASAEYLGTQMTLTFSVYLGDGFGKFQKLDQNITRAIAAPMPLNPSQSGQFHMTNLNGSNYPSLSYVYQEKNSKTYVCLSVDGKSNGTVSEAILCRLAGDMPSNEMEVIPVDLNGNGMGDWLFFTVENDQPRVVPVYNNATVTDFLSWAEDPMGLRTTITYGSLSDPAVYSAGVDWRNYNNTATDSYAVLAAPNYVVTALEHRNNDLLNSLSYHVSIQKSYGSARVNTQGRGWQGFGAINTLNVLDSVLTTEKYCQVWPLTGLKSEINTMTIDHQLLKSEKVTYESAFINRGPWKIYRTNKVLERTDMLDDGIVVRSNATSYAYDEHGNIVMQSPSETQRGLLMYQSWQKCTYTTINGITGLLTSKKLSANLQNADMSKFQPGDSSLTLLEYDPSTATLRTISEWSTDVGAFSVKTFGFDEYGNEVRSVDAAGLETSTIYDELFKAYPVKITERGPGVSSVQLSAFDEASGKEVAKLEENGFLACYRVDGFGRIFETRLRISEESAHSTTAEYFFANRPFVQDPSFVAVLEGCSLNPHKVSTFRRLKGASGSAYICTTTLSYSKAGTDGQSELTEVMDCVGQVRKQSTRNADDDERTWKSWEYDSRGQHVFESWPSKAPASSGLDWTANHTNGVRSTFDILGRPKTRVRPAHADQKHFVTTLTTYLEGGAQVEERILTTSDAAAPLNSALQLSSVKKRYVRIGGEDHVIESVDENGLSSRFQFDAFGTMIRATDPAGQVEQRSYNAKGNIVMLDNPYQNIVSVGGVQAIQYQYNIANQLTCETNAIGEAVTYQRDAKGRPVQKIGHDGRTLVYEYDQGDTENLSAVTIYPHGPQMAFESRFEFAYDSQGRNRERSLILSDGTVHKTSTSYNWLGQIVQKVLPDGSTITYEYRGSAMRSSTLSGGSKSNWSLKADILQHSAFAKTEKLVLQGTGMQEAFAHDWTYDSQGFPLSHTLGTQSRTLVQEHYLYNDVDQLARKHEFITGATTDYTYSGRRLASSQAAEGPMHTYTYDASGNLLQNRETAITYVPGRAVGTKNGVTAFDVTYDGAGRMRHRITEDSSTTFTYDSFGNLKSSNDTISNATVEIFTDYDGETLQRKHSDGSVDLFVDDEFSIHIQPNGSKVIRHRLLDDEYVLGTVSNTYESVDSTRPLGGGRRSINVQFTDTKGSVNRIFSGENAELQEELEYDAFGLLETLPKFEGVEADLTSAYEGKCLDETTGLLDFGARWYDPLVGRFTTPDDILDVGSLIRTDGNNRYAFENNDPINHVDPTGHWSWSSIGGAVLSVGLIVGAVALTVATGGAAAPLAAMAVGALAGGGVAGLIYSVEHHDEKNAGKFWGGFATTVAINAAIGAATGAFGAWASPAKAVSATGRLASGLSRSVSQSAIKAIGTLASVGGKAAIAGGASVMGKAGERFVENTFYGSNHSLFEGAGKTFAQGAAIGAIAGMWSAKGGSSSPNKLKGINKFEGSFKLRSFQGIKAVLAPKPTNPWTQMPGITKQIMKASLKPGLKLAKWGYSQVK